MQRSLQRVETPLQGKFLGSPRARFAHSVELTGLWESALSCQANNQNTFDQTTSVRSTKLQRQLQRVETPSSR